MKKILLFTAVSLVSGALFAQTQIGNGDMENWANNDEPDNWNSFLTAGGTWSGFASDQCDEETADLRPGTTGTSACRIWSESTLGIVANGNVTLGKIEMGSTTPSSPNNYNWSETADSDFSEALTDSPDSIVFWAKFTPNGGNGNARMKATLHTNYDYRDPEDAASTAEVHATAVVNYPSTNGNWVRFSAPFDYSGAAASHAYILVTFTTNENAGGGDAGDVVLIDDVELIYNPNSIDDINPNNIVVSMNNAQDMISVSSDSELNGDYVIYSAMGQIIQEGAIASEISFTAEPGVYFVHVGDEGRIVKFEILKF